MRVYTISVEGWRGREEREKKREMEGGRMEGMEGGMNVGRDHRHTAAAIIGAKHRVLTIICLVNRTEALPVDYISYI
jgi:hypothetical protein